MKNTVTKHDNTRNEQTLTSLRAFLSKMWLFVPDLCKRLRKFRRLWKRFLRLKYNFCACSHGSENKNDNVICKKKYQDFSTLPNCPQCPPVTHGLKGNLFYMKSSQERCILTRIGDVDMENHHPLYFSEDALTLATNDDLH